MNIQIKISPSSSIGILAKLLLGQDFKNGLIITLKIPQALLEPDNQWQNIGMNEWLTDVQYDIDLT